MTIRDAREDDLPAIVAIYNAAIPGRMATADTEPVTVEQRRPWLQQYTPDRYPLWVDEQDGEIVGWLGFRMFYGRPAYAATAEVSVYINLGRQNQGVGRGLVAEAIRRGPALGLKTLLYLTFTHNAPVAAWPKGWDSRVGVSYPVWPNWMASNGDLLILGRRLDAHDG